MKAQDFWAALRIAVAGVVPHLYENKKIAETPAVVISPESETGVRTLGEGYEHGNAELAFRVTVISDVGWESAMALAPTVRAAVEGLEAEFIGLDRIDYLASDEGARPLFALSFRFVAGVTADPIFTA